MNGQRTRLNHFRISPHFHTGRGWFAGAESNSQRPTTSLGLEPGWIQPIHLTRLVGTTNRTLTSPNLQPKGEVAPLRRWLATGENRTGPLSNKFRSYFSHQNGEYYRRGSAVLAATRWQIQLNAIKISGKEPPRWYDHRCRSPFLIILTHGSVDGNLIALLTWSLKMPSTKGTSYTCRSHPSSRQGLIGLIPNWVGSQVRMVDKALGDHSLWQRGNLDRYRAAFLPVVLKDSTKEDGRYIGKIKTFVISRLDSQAIRKDFQLKGPTRGQIIF